MRIDEEGPASKKAVYAALAGNLLVAVTKFAAAAMTGSSSMLSEGVHSLVDTGNQGLLLSGYRRGDREPDPSQPLGCGRELSFWSFIVALLLFVVGAGAAFYEGIAHIRERRPIDRPVVNYVVLALSAAFEGTSWLVAFRNFRARKGRRSYWRAVRESKDPPALMVLFEDTEALLGIAIAATGIFAAGRFRMPRPDRVPSTLIAATL